MKIDSFGQPVYSEIDIFEQLMLSGECSPTVPFQVELPECIDNDLVNEMVGKCVMQRYEPPNCSISEFDRNNQAYWMMPDQYRKMDIAKHVLDLCDGNAELQRCGAELLLYQERDMFDVLRYLVYLVDTMRDNGIIWGMGRGSSVASFVLYKLGVHRVDSLYYDLDITEFLR